MISCRQGELMFKDNKTKNRKDNKKQKKVRIKKLTQWVYMVRY